MDRILLSEHTTSVNKVEEERAYTYPPKAEMEIEEIGEFYMRLF